MKYSVQIFAIVAGIVSTTLAHAEQLEAPSDHEAVNKARASHAVPEEGGDYEVVVSALEAGPLVKTWDAGKKDFVDAPRPIGEISRFKVCHEPAAHLREALAAKAAEEARLAEAAAAREAHRQELLAELGLTSEQAATLKAKVSK